MRATEIIRGVLDLIDQLDCHQQDSANAAEQPAQTGVDSTRFKHIFSMLAAERNNPGLYDNSPNPTVAGIDAVTKDASGGEHGPKNPADLRSDSVSMYPNFQAKI